MTRAAILACLAASVATLQVARADNGIVLESYTNERPADAKRLVAPVLEELSQHHYDSGDTVAHRYDPVARAAITSGLPADFVAQVDAGYKAWIAGRFDETIKILTPLVETAHANPGAFAGDAAPREALQRALIGLALAHQRRGDPGAAKSTLAELVRAFPDAQVLRATYGPEASDLFAQVQRDVAAAGKGKLAIKVSDETAQIFIDERPLSVGTATAELPPGEYRVFAKMGRRLSRSHRVVIRANDSAQVTIDAGLDLAMRTTPFVGLVVATSVEREAREGQYADAVAQAVNADSVIVVGIDQVRGRTAVVASLVSMQTGREIRRASVAVDPDPSNERLRALAKFVAGEEPNGNIEVLYPAPGQPLPPVATSKSTGIVTAEPDPVVAPPAPPQREEPPHHGWGGWKWISATAALGALGTGGVLLSLDGSCSVSEPAGHPCPDLRNTKAPAYGALGAGVALTGLTIYLFARGGHHDEPARTAFVLPTQGGALAGFTARF